MAFEQQEHFFNCPHCFAAVSVLVDPSVPAQEYIEDCEVCCNPISFTVQFQGDELVRFEANRLDD
jgi:transcription elongation factor Elf1